MADKNEAELVDNGYIFKSQKEHTMWEQGVEF